MKSILKNSNGNAISVGGKLLGGGESTLKKLLDTTKTTQYLFSRYTGTSVDDLIKYDDTENVEVMNNMFEYNSNLVSPPLLNTSKVKNMSYAFSSCSSILEFPQYDYSQVENLRYTFSGCKKITKLSLNTTEKLNNLSYAFNGCNALVEINISNISNVTTLNTTFNGCKKIKNITLDTIKVNDFYLSFQSCEELEYVKLTTDNATNLSNTFTYCSKLQTIDLSSLDKVTSISRFADSCYKLTKLIIRTMTVIPKLESSSFNKCYHFTGTVNSTYNPDGLKDGRIYVPDEWVEQLKSATNWSEYGDIIVPLSTLEE